MLINGDTSNEIENVFNKYRGGSCTVENTDDGQHDKTTTEVLDISKLYSTVHMLQLEIVVMKESRTKESAIMISYKLT